MSDLSDDIYYIVCIKFNFWRLKGSPFNFPWCVGVGEISTPPENSSPRGRKVAKMPIPVLADFIKIDIVGILVYFEL